MIPEYLSKKLHFLSAFLLLLILLSHSYNIHVRIVDIDANGFNLALQNIISKAFCLIAVPVYLMTSGFFFFKGQTEYPVASYRKKFLARLRSLLIPFLLVSGIVLVFFYTVQSIPSLSAFFNKDLITDKSFTELLHIWLLNPLSYHLWYLQYLFILTIISPLIFVLIKRGGLIYLIPVLLIWIVFSNELPDNTARSLALFSVGAYISIKGINIEPYRRKSAMFLFCFIWVLFACFQYFFLAKGSIAMISFLNVSIIFGIITIWIAYDCFYETIRKSFSFMDKYIYPFSFFIFLFHEPILTIVVKIMIMVLGTSNTTSIAMYFAAPVVTFTVCWVIAVSVKKILPPFYRMVTGSRNK